MKFSKKHRLMKIVLTLFLTILTVSNPRNLIFATKFPPTKNFNLYVYPKAQNVVPIEKIIKKHLDANFFIRKSCLNKQNFPVTIVKINPQNVFFKPIIVKTIDLLKYITDPAKTQFYEPHRNAIIESLKEQKLKYNFPNFEDLVKNLKKIINYEEIKENVLGSVKNTELLYGEINNKKGQTSNENKIDINKAQKFEINLSNFDKLLKIIRDCSTAIEKSKINEQYLKTYNFEIKQLFNNLLTQLNGFKDYVINNFVKNTTEVYLNMVSEFEKNCDKTKYNKQIKNQFVKKIDDTEQNKKIRFELENKISDYFNTIINKRGLMELEDKPRTNLNALFNCCLEPPEKAIVNNWNDKSILNFANIYNKYDNIIELFFNGDCKINEKIRKGLQCIENYIGQVTSYLNQLKNETDEEFKKKIQNLLFYIESIQKQFYIVKFSNEQSVVYDLKTLIKLKEALEALTDEKSVLKQIIFPTKIQFIETEIGNLDVAKDFFVEAYNIFINVVSEQFYGSLCEHYKRTIIGKLIKEPVFGKIYLIPFIKSYFKTQLQEKNFILNDFLPQFIDRNYLDSLLNSVFSDLFDKIKTKVEITLEKIKTINPKDFEKTYEIYTNQFKPYDEKNFNFQQINEFKENGSLCLLSKKSVEQYFEKYKSLIDKINEI